ncbi:MAG: DUF1127 domain-containing protein [Proteobacteria bacterium]|nr:MAG: DUF1127 domain-containing protein [Pseudomonadota bacterium]
MITRFFRALRRWHTRNVTIRELTALADWQLRDLGVTRGEIPSLVDRLISGPPALPAIELTTSAQVEANRAEKLPVETSRKERAIAA